MALPKIQSPIHQFKLPVLDRMIKYRPFTVKEEKILLMAAESDDPADTYTAFQQVVSNCIVDDEIDPSKLHIFDLEVLFLLLRIASVGEDSEFSIKDRETEEWVPITLNLRDVVDSSVKDAVIPSKQIQITEEVGVILKDVTLDLFLDETGRDGEADMSAEDAFNIIKKMIDSVYDKEDVYLISDSSDEEVTEFLESFSSDDLEKVYNYLAQVPRVRTVLKYKLKNGEEKTSILEGITDFFPSA